MLERDPRPCPPTPTRRSTGTGGAHRRFATPTPCSPGCATSCATGPGRPRGALAAGATDWPLTDQAARRRSTTRRPSPATRTSSCWRAGARRSSGSCAARCSPRRMSPCSTASWSRAWPSPATASSTAWTRASTAAARPIRRRPRRCRQRPTRRRAGLARRRRRRRRRDRRGHRDHLPLALLPPARRRRVPPAGRPDRRRPRLPEVRRRSSATTARSRSRSPTPVDDDELRARLLDPATFERGRDGCCRRPDRGSTRHAPSRSRRVHVMAKLLNRLRRFPDDDGGPLVRRVPRGRRRPHVHEPAVRAGLLAGHGASHALADAVARHDGDLHAVRIGLRAQSARRSSRGTTRAVMADRDNREADADRRSRRVRSACVHARSDA